MLHMEYVDGREGQEGVEVLKGGAETSVNDRHKERKE